MGAEVPTKCCAISIAANEANECNMLNKEAQKKFSYHDTAEPETVTNQSDLSTKRRHKHKKKKRSHHHEKKLKYKVSKRAQSLQVCNNPMDDVVDNEYAQYQILNAQNQQFIGKHASYFAETYNDQETIYSNYSNDSFDSLPSVAAAAGSMSPLCELSNNQANIILSFSDLSSPRSRGRSYSTPTSAATVAASHIKCKCVDDCIAIQRVLDALRWYARFGENNCELLMENVADIYQYLVDDYRHILSKHLTQELEINMGMEYDLIKSKIEREVTPCDKKTCVGHRRYKQYKQYASYHEFEQPFLTFMDSMHCFFLHSGSL